MLCFPNHPTETLPAPAMSFIFKAQSASINAMFPMVKSQKPFLGVHALEFLGVMAVVLSETSALCQATIQPVRLWADTDILFLSSSAKGFLCKTLVLLSSLSALTKVVI